MAEQRPTAVESGPTQLTPQPVYEVYADGYGGSYEPDYSAAYDGAAQEYTIASPAQRPSGLGAGSRIGLRADFGAHFEANYQRLVGQLFAITLNSAEAHDVVQDAYSRAWRQWSAIGRRPDPAAWIRRVAVRSTVRSWRRRLAWIGVGRPTPIADEAGDPRTGAVLAALSRLGIAERRAGGLPHKGGRAGGPDAPGGGATPGAGQPPPA